MADISLKESFVPDQIPNSSFIKVSTTSHARSVAGAIAAVMRQQKHAEIQAIGAGAVNQAVKAIAITRIFLTQDNLDIVCVAQLVNIDIDSRMCTAVRFSVTSK